MLVKTMIFIALVLGVVAVVKRPFAAQGKMREFANNILLGLGTYYGVYIVFYSFEYDETAAMGAGGVAAVIAVLILNVFFRKT